VQFTTNVQRQLGVPQLRVLFGAGASRMLIREIPQGATRSLLSDELDGREALEGWSNYARAGLVWDSRDRETHTSRGTWADILVQRADQALGSEWSYTRVTGTLRHYVPVSPSLTLAERLIVQNVSGAAPFHDLGTVQTSFKPQEGLGGSNTLRGFARSRFLGKGLAVLNSEIRWRATRFELLGAPSSVTLSAFVDAGRVWSDKLELSSVGSDLHVGYGGGVRLGRGPNFVVALDIGHSTESAAAIYIGMGFLF